jgi:hypothetical protein
VVENCEAAHEWHPQEVLAGPFTRPLFGSTSALFVGHGVFRQYFGSIWGGQGVLIGRVLGDRTAQVELTEVEECEALGAGGAVERAPW